MTTSRRVPTNPTINSYGSGKDYTSLTAWEAATDVDMVATTTSYILEIYGDSYNDGNIIMAGAAGDTDASYFRVVRPASGNFLTSGAISKKHFAYTTVAYIVCQINEQYSEWQDIVASFNCAQGNTNTNVFRAYGGESGFVGCVTMDSSNTSLNKKCSGFYISGEAGRTGHAINCLSHNNTGSGFDLVTYAGSTNYCYNCTSVGNGLYGFNGDNSTACKCYGCGSDGNAGGDFDSANLSLTDCNDSTPTFAAGTDNFHLDAADTTWKDADTNSGAWHSSCGYDDDIDGNTRSGSWDIGWDEVSGGGASLPLKNVFGRPFSGVFR